MHLFIPEYDVTAYLLRRLAGGRAECYHTFVAAIDVSRIDYIRCSCSITACKRCTQQEASQA